MPSEKETEKCFCPFCGQDFEGGGKICPNCGQDIGPYKDDLSPILNKIQTATNIDMKSTKVKAASAILVIMLMIVAGLVILDFMESNRSDTPPISGIEVQIKTNGYLDLTEDFASGEMSVLPIYDPSLRLRISLDQELTGEFDKVVWIVRTGSYNSDNPKNPFYLKVTKESSSGDDVYSVTWTTVDVGSFDVVAQCTDAKGNETVYSGHGLYYGKLHRTYEWTWLGIDNSLDYTLPSDAVSKYLTADAEKRTELQKTTPMTSFISDDAAIEELSGKLSSLYSKNYRDLGVGFGDFVLSFVQSCFPAVPDSFSYGTADWWAYPQEIILKGCGDDEDRAILFCSLMETEGLKTGLMDIGGYTMAMTETHSKDSSQNIYMTDDCVYLVTDVISGNNAGDMGVVYTMKDNVLVRYGEPVPDGYSVYLRGQQSNTD